MPKTIFVKSSLQDNAFINRAYEIFKRQVESRSNTIVYNDQAGDLDIYFEIYEGIGKEGFRISTVPGRSVTVAGNECLGLLYGIGKLLRCANYETGEFVPGDFTGSSVPKKEIRGVYFATHFHNYYHDAPIEKVKEYIEDMVLWGTNLLVVWFDMHHYRSLSEPEAMEMTLRLRKIMIFAHDINLKLCLMMIGNEAFDESPKELRALFTAGHDGYTRQLAGHYHVELCPSKIVGLELLLRWHREVLLSFQDMELDYLCIWPYDQGGCTCSDCKPWGSNGFLKVAQPLAELARSMFPDVKIILSTWMFDSFTTGEWKSLSTVLKYKASCFNYLMIEFMDGYLPNELVKNGFPCKLPCVGFPEISMYGATPWGGFGANPIPCRIQYFWEASSEYLYGGFPYSEGIFDDINKVIYMQLYWGESGNVHEIVKEYVKYEFGGLNVEEIVKAVYLLECSIVRNRLDEKDKIHNYPDSKITWKGEQRFVIENSNGVKEAFFIISKMDEQLPSWVRNSWRWRILYLRSFIDNELLHNGFKTNENIEKAYQELTVIYYAQNADYCVAPPTLASINSNRGGFSWT